MDTTIYLEDLERRIYRDGYLHHDHGWYLFNDDRQHEANHGFGHVHGNQYQRD